MIAVTSLQMSFGDTKALVDCQFKVEAGSIHGLLGENGSGKSTLVKVLSGVLTPLGGEVWLNKTHVTRFTPRLMSRLGVATVFQEVLDAPNCTGLQNMFLGAYGPFTSGVRRRADCLARATTLLHQMTDDTVPLEIPVEELPLAQRQLITISRAILREPKILILDEATSALGSADREGFFDVIRGLAKSGCAILYITHRMDELMGLTDMVTVMRGGESVGTLVRRETDISTLLKMMSPSRDQHASALVTDAQSPTTGSAQP